MNSMTIPFLIANLCFIPIYFFIIYRSIRLFAGYSMSTHLVSDLGIKVSHYRILFNAGTVVYGVVGTLIPFVLLQVLPKTTFTTISVVSITITSLCLALLGLFPMDKPVLHASLSVIEFAALFMSYLFTLYIFLNSSIFPSILILLNVILLMCIVLFTWALFMKSDKVFLLEWIIFLGTILWNFTIGFTMLISI